MAQDYGPTTGWRLRMLRARRSGAREDAPPGPDCSEPPSLSDPVEVDRLQGQMWRLAALAVVFGLVAGGFVGVLLALGGSGRATAALAPQVLPWVSGLVGIVLAIHVRMWATGGEMADEQDPDLRNRGHARVLYLESLLLGIGLGVLMLAGVVSICALLFQTYVVHSLLILAAAVLLALLTADVGAVPRRDARAHEEHRSSDRVARLKRAADYWAGRGPSTRPGVLHTAVYVAGLGTVASAAGLAAASALWFVSNELPPVQGVVSAWMFSIVLATLIFGAWYATLSTLVNGLPVLAVLLGAMGAIAWLSMLLALAVAALQPSASYQWLTMLAVSTALPPLLLPVRNTKRPGKPRWLRDVPVRYIAASAASSYSEVLDPGDSTLQPPLRPRRVRRWYDAISGMQPDES